MDCSSDAIRYLDKKWASARTKKRRDSIFQEMVTASAEIKRSFQIAKQNENFEIFWQKWKKSGAEKINILIILLSFDSGRTKAAKKTWARNVNGRLKKIFCTEKIV